MGKDKTKKDKTNKDKDALSNQKGKKNHLKVAIIDIGSNSVRLVVLRIKKKKSELLENNKHICELGNMTEDGRLSGKNQKKAFKALKEFKKHLDKECIDHIIPVATAAARNSANGQDFIEKAEKILGHRIKVLSDEEEARYAAFGVIAARTGKKHEIDIDGIVADLGGGSLELAKVRDNEVLDGLSLKLGTLVLKQETDPVTKIRHTLSEVDPEFKNARNLYVIGGSWRAVKQTLLDAADHEKDNGISKSDLDLIDKESLTRISSETLISHLERIIELEDTPPAKKDKNGKKRPKDKFPDDLDRKARSLYQEFPDLKPDRANKIFDASRLLRELIDECGSDNVVFVESGLREGLVYLYMMHSFLTLEASQNFFHMHSGSSKKPDVEVSDDDAQLNFISKPQSCTHD